MTAGSGDVTVDEPPVETAARGDGPSKGLLGGRERTVTTAAGATLLALGLKRRSLVGAAAALAGGWLVYRGLAGKRPLGRSSGADVDVDADDGRRGATETERSVTVGKPAEELHELWRDPETASRVFGEFVEVSAPDEDRQRWTVSGPFGRETTVETRIVEDRPGEVLRWESVDGARLPMEGSIRFRPAPGDRGTEATLRLRFEPPGGALGEAVAERFAVVPGTLAERALDRFKSLAETGEIPTIGTNPSARGRGDLL